MTFLTSGLKDRETVKVDSSGQKTEHLSRVCMTVAVGLNTKRREPDAASAAVKRIPIWLVCHLFGRLQSASVGHKQKVF